jgi:hypothetical protein
MSSHENYSSDETAFDEIFMRESAIASARALS